VCAEGLTKNGRTEKTTYDTYSSSTPLCHYYSAIITKKTEKNEIVERIKMPMIWPTKAEKRRLKQPNYE